MPGSLYIGLFAYLLDIHLKIYVNLDETFLYSFQFLNKTNFNY